VEDRVKPLVRRGLMTIAIASEDRRSRALALTPAGRALLAKAVPVWRRTHGELERLFADADALLLRQALRILP
jgi:DNA-binding MarR family transcriptional regulator